MLASDDELIDLIYSSLLGETSWRTFLDRVSSELPGGMAALFSHDVSRGAGAVAISAGRDESMNADYERYYANLNPWMPRCALVQLGRGILADDMFPREALVKTEYYNDFLVANDVQSSLGVVVMREEGRSLMLTALTDSADHDRNRAMADRFTRLAPHLRRAADFYKNNSHARAATELGGSLFDAVDIGMIMVGEGCRPKTMSERGQELLSAGTAVRLSPVGRIVFSDERAQSVLAGMLERTYEGPKSASFDTESARLTLVHVRKDRFSFFFEGPTVILLVEKPDASFRRTFDLPRFVHDYRLSAGETRALTGIVAGKNTEEIAADAFLSRETIRSQTKSLYLKVGVRSQSELLRLALGGRAPD